MLGSKTNSKNKKNFQVSGGEEHSLELKSNGKVYSWGWNGAGQLGNGTLNSSLVPVLVLLDKKIVQISAGGYHSLALTSDEKVYFWGWDGFETLNPGVYLG